MSANSVSLAGYFHGRGVRPMATAAWCPSVLRDPTGLAAVRPADLRDQESAAVRGYFRRPRIGMGSLP